MKTIQHLRKKTTTEPWGAVSSVVSFADDTWSAFDTSSKVVVSNNLDDSFDPFSAKNLAPAPAPPAVTRSKTSADPFGQANEVNKSFGLSSSVSSSNTLDPFGSAAWSSNFSSETPKTPTDPFSGAPPSVTRSKTSTDPFGQAAFGIAAAGFGSTPNKSVISTPPSKSSQNRLQKSQTTAHVSGGGSTSKVSQSLSRPWGSPHDPFGTNSNSSGGTSSIPRSRPNTATRSDTGFGDPFKTVPELTLPKREDATVSSTTEIGKKEKKNFKIGNFKPSFIKKDKDKNKSNSFSSGANIAGGAGPAGAKVIKNDLASRTSPLPSAPPTSETERLERLRIQEEQDLAYAIALSRAEAASVNN